MFIDEKIIYIFFVIVIFMLVSKISYEDELNMQRQYVKDVCENVYPDYKKLKVKCEEN